MPNRKLMTVWIVGQKSLPPSLFSPFLSTDPKRINIKFTVHLINIGSSKIGTGILYCHQTPSSFLRVQTWNERKFGSSEQYISPKSNNNLMSLNPYSIDGISRCQYSPVPSP